MIFRVNLAIGLAATLLWSYGIQAVAGPVGFVPGQLVLSTGLAAFFAFLVFRAELLEPSWIHSVQIGRRSIQVGVLVLAGLSLLSWKELHQDLVGDQLYHVQQSFIHAVKFLEKPGISEWFLHHGWADLSYSTLIRLLSWVGVVGAGLGFFALFKMKNSHWRFCAAFLGFLIIRLAILSFKNAGDPHPPLRLLPLQLTGLFLGFSPFVFRWLGILAISVWATAIYERILPRVGPVSAAIGVAFLSTLPAFWHLGTLPEASLWACVIWSWIAVEVVASTDEPDWLWICFVLALGSLMRQSIFVAWIPVGAFLCWKIIVQKYPFSKLYPAIAAWILILPWTGHVFLGGTPASDPEKIPLFTKLVESMRDGFFFKMWVYHIQWPALIWVPFGLLIGAVTKKHRLFPLAMFGLAYVLFYSIRPSLWGIPRYQAEMLFPLIVLGVLFVLFYPKIRKPISVILVVGVLWNIWTFKNIASSNAGVDSGTLFDDWRSGRTRMTSEVVFDYSRALAWVRQNRGFEGLYVDGITYGYFPEVLEGSSVREILQRRQLPPIWGGVTGDQILKLPQVKTVLLADWGVTYNQKIREVLYQNGWKDLQTFVHPQYQTTVWVLGR